MKFHTHRNVLNNLILYQTTSSSGRYMMLLLRHLVIKNGISNKARVQPCLIFIIESVHQMIKCTCCDGKEVDQSGFNAAPKTMRMGGVNHFIELWKVNTILYLFTNVSDIMYIENREHLKMYYICNIIYYININCNWLKNKWINWFLTSRISEHYFP